MLLSIVENQAECLEHADTQQIFVEWISEWVDGCAGCSTSIATRAFPLNSLQTMMSALKNRAGKISSRAGTVASEIFSAFWTWSVGTAAELSPWHQVNPMPWVGGKQWLVRSLLQRAPSMRGPCALCAGKAVPPEAPKALPPVYRSSCMAQSQSLERHLILLTLVDGTRLFYLNLDKFFIRKYLFWVIDLYV